jgi:hypothetical protein
MHGKIGNKLYSISLTTTEPADWPSILMYYDVETDNFVDIGILSDMLPENYKECLFPLGNINNKLMFLDLTSDKYVLYDTDENTFETCTIFDNRSVLMVWETIMVLVDKINVQHIQILVFKQIIIILFLM